MMAGLVSALTAFLVALAVAGMMLRAGILDRPNERSNHRDPTPRGGGLGAMAGVFAAWALLDAGSPATGAALAGIALGGGVAAALGLLDDLVTLSETLKFMVLALVSIAVAGMAGPVTELGIALPWLVGLAGSALWIFTTANAVNFMDGSDGLIAAVLIPAALALGVLAEGSVAVAAFGVAGAMAGFAVWNAPLASARGRLFCGDVGALGMAVVFAGLALVWARMSGEGAVWLAPLLILPLLGDVLLTMAARVRAGRSAFVAHRAHAYQLMIALGASHRRVAGLWAVWSAGCGVAALAARALGGGWINALALVAGIAAFWIFHRQVRKRADAAGLDVYQ